MRKVSFLSYNGTILKTLYVNATTYSGAIKMALWKLKEKRIILDYEYIMVSVHNYDPDGKISKNDKLNTDFNF